MEYFYIHFNKDDHCLTIDEFDLVIKSVKDVFNNLNDDIIESDIKAELVVYAPEKGSLLVTIGAIAGGTIYFLETDIGKKFVKGLTGNEPSYYAEKAGLLIKDLLTAIYSKSQSEIKQIIEDLKEINNKILKLDKSIKAKSDFYRMCLSNKEIKDIGFDKTENYLISRQGFQNHVSKDIVRHIPSDIMLQELIVTRPVTVESKAKWELKDKATNEKANYSLADEDFKRKVLDGNMLKQTKNDDYLIAKVEYVKELKNGVEKNLDKKILEVYQFNDMHFATIPSDLELNKMVEKESTKEQLSLWDQNNYNELELAVDGGN